MNHWTDRNIALLGLGVEGRSLLAYLQCHGVDRITVRDRNEDLEVPAGIRKKLGPEMFDGLQEHDLVLRSPGVPCLHPALAELDGTRTELSSLVRLVLDRATCPVIGVTGTKGKGTTSTLLHEMLLASGLRSFLGGNIGTSPLDFLDELLPDDHLVLELSSFQLQDLHRSPDLAIILGVTSEHLDYHADLEEYHRAKASLVRYQGPQDLAIVNIDYPGFERYRDAGRGQILEVSTRRPVTQGAGIRNGQIELLLEERITLCSVEEVALLGRHQLENILPASLAALRSGAQLDAIRQVIRTFEGLPHRLERVLEREGRFFYDDSCSTTPETAIAALSAFESGTVLLLLGGSEKHSDFSELGRAITRNACRPIVYGATGPRIEQAIRLANPSYPITRCSGLGEAIGVAWNASRPGDRIVLSPGCASFDEFRNYADRAHFFRKEIASLSWAG